MRLKMEDLGKMEKYKGEEVYTHMMNYQRYYKRKYQKANPAGLRLYRPSRMSTWDTSVKG